MGHTSVSVKTAARDSAGMSELPKDMAVRVGLRPVTCLFGGEAVGFTSQPRFGRPRPRFLLSER